MDSSKHQIASASESFAAMWARRLVTLPTMFLLTAVASVLTPLMLPVILIADLVWRRKWGLTRTTLFLLSFLWCEIIGIIYSSILWLVFVGGISDKLRRGFVRENFRLQAVWVKTIFGSARFLFRMRVTIEGRAPATGHRPLLVFVRHASTVDTGLPIIFLSYPLGYQPRYVLKRELLLDPCLDIVGNRIPNRFVRRGDRTVDEVERVVSLYEQLGSHDAVVIFPEGTRFSERKRSEVLTQLRARGPSPALELAESLQYTLSPLRKGALALLEKNPGCDLVVIAHRGLEQATSFAAFTRGTLVGAHVKVQLVHVPFDELPKDADGRTHLLAQLWRDVDRFAAPEKPHNSKKASDG